MFSLVVISYDVNRVRPKVCGSFHPPFIQEPDTIKSWNKQSEGWNSQKMPSKCGAVSSLWTITVLLSISSTTKNSKISWLVVNVKFFFGEYRGSHQCAACKTNKHILRVRTHVSMVCLPTWPEISNASLNTSAVKGRPGECRLYNKAAVPRNTTKRYTSTLRWVLMQLRTSPTWRQNRIRSVSSFWTTFATLPPSVS
jgi:hypothetical protein